MTWAVYSPKCFDCGQERHVITSTFYGPLCAECATNMAAHMMQNAAQYLDEILEIHPERETAETERFFSFIEEPLQLLCLLEAMGH